MSASREKQIKRLEQQAAKIEKWLSENDKKIGVNLRFCIGCIKRLRGANNKI
jgi:hypothetical protein